MLSRLHKAAITPKQTDRELRNREIILNVLLGGTFVLLLMTFLLLTYGYFAWQSDYAARILGLGFGLAVIGTLFVLSRLGHILIASALLIALYFVIATIVIYRWGILTHTGILLYGLVIVLGGILIRPAFSIYSVLVIVATMMVLQILAQNGTINSDWSWLAEDPEPRDLYGPLFIFGTMALVSWLFNQQMERSLRLAEQAEKALKKQNDMLEAMVEERTRELRVAQLEKVAQMYRFAEIGQISTTLMHDLANHLTSLNLNIENLEEKTRSKFLKQAKRSIRYLDDMVARVRDQLHGRTKIRAFNVAHEIDEITKMLRHRGQTAGVGLKWQPPANKKDLLCRGDQVRFRQMMANLICNGFDAYGEPKGGERREVLVTAAGKHPNIVLTIEDWGGGIPDKERDKLFRPFHSTKKTGMGMGLFIVKQIVDEHFLGSVYIDSSKKHTSFVVKLPKASS